MRAAAWTVSILCLFLSAPSIGQTAPEVPAPEATPPAPTAPTAPAITVTDVVITGNTVIPTDEIRKVITVRPGEALTPAGYRESADAIEKLYSDSGYQAVVSPEATSVSENGVVTFRITEAVVESVEVRGNRKTKASTVLRMVDMKPGEIYRRELAQADVRALYNLGIFEDVSYRVEPGSELGRVKVVYVIDEAKTGLVTAGLSYSGSGGLIGQVEVVETNLGGQANALGAFVQSGGKYYRSGFQLTFHDPFVGNRDTALDVGAYAKTIYRFSGNDIFQTEFENGLGYDEFRTGGDLSLSRRLGENLRAGLGFRGSHVKARYTYDAFVPGPSEGTGYYVTDLRNPGIGDGNVYAGLVALAHDRRDYTLDPASGGVQVAGLEFGHTSVGGRTVAYGVSEAGEPLTVTVPGESGSLTRLSVDFRQYYSHGRTNEAPTKPVRVLAVRLVAGATGGTVPFWEQFFVGGIGLGGVQYARFLTPETLYNDPFISSAQALRGYDEGRFWGRNMLVGSIEYRIPLGEALRGVVFVDSGDAWNNSLKVLNPYDPGSKSQDSSFQLHSSVGLGLRVATPFGPIRIDYGIGSEGGRTHFSIGQVF